VRGRFSGRPEANNLSCASLERPSRDTASAAPATGARADANISKRLSKQWEYSVGAAVPIVDDDKSYRWLVQDRLRTFFQQGVGFGFIGPDELDTSMEFILQVLRVDKSRMTAPAKVLP
jgi:hypothetical protein